jgi:UDP-N-acetylmuramoylalanine--D-glutamate ligase
MQLQGQHVLILGLGASGLAMARWCAHAGADVTVADTRDSATRNWQLCKPSALPCALCRGLLWPVLVEGTAVRAVFPQPGPGPAEVAPVVDAARKAWACGKAAS